MKCPFCSHLETQVVDSRITEDYTAVRRRRRCMSCSSRFTTYERFEDPAFLVIKKDSRRERFERQKIFNGILKACEKRPISMEQIEVICSNIEKELKSSPDREVASVTIGRKVMESLRDLDHVAYVRFASVYKEFEDIGAFKKILEGLAEKQGNDGYGRENFDKVEVKG